VPRPSLRDRFLTPQVARAITSPEGILLAGAGAALGVLATGAAPVAALLGLGAWAVRVLVALPSGGPPGESVDPFRLGEPWRRFVVDAQQAQRRFDDVVRRTREGPMQDRLQSIAERVGDAVQEGWRIARDGDQLDTALRTLDARAIHGELLEVIEERRGTRSPSAAAALDATRRSLEAQLALVDRLESGATDARQRLRVLTEQLDEMVARAVEISVQAGTSGDLSAVGALGAEVEDVVGELEALRSALAETAAVAGDTAGGSAGTTAAGTA
jgi:hypothetical protein